MYAFENDKSYLIRQKTVPFGEGPKSEDGCQSWLLIVTSYIVLLITFHNKQFLIRVWALMANNNVNNEALCDTWLPGPLLKRRLWIVECFGYMAVENGKIYCLISVS